MRNEADIRKHKQTIEAMMDLPGEVPECMAVLPLSHIALLGWVLGEDTPEARAVADVYLAIAKDVEEFHKKVDEKRKLLFPAEPLIN